MTKDKNIFIKNIYYMLSYAFQVLKQSNYNEVSTEDFDHAEDLFAAILAKCISRQLKQGLYRIYICVALNVDVGDICSLRTCREG